MIDARINIGKPLTITFHCNMDTKGKKPVEQWAQAIPNILDYVKGKGDQVKVITYAQLVDLYFPPK